MKHLCAFIGQIIKKLFTADYPYCIYCETEYGVNRNTLSCPACEAKIAIRNMKDEVFGFGYTAALSFEGPVKDMVHRFKYGGAKYLGERMAYLLNGTCDLFRINADVLANVPLHRNKKKKRGYDQSAVIAKALSKLTGIPYLPALKRTVDTPTQTNLDRQQRIENVCNAFAADADVRGKHILLIDDVLTTGSTSAECARVLIKNGASAVDILAFAKAVD